MPKPPSDDQGRPAGDDPYKKKRPFGQGRPTGGPRKFGDKPPRKFGDKPRSFGKDRPEGDRPRSFGDKPRKFGDKPQGGFRKDRPEGDRPRSFGDKPRPYGDKPRPFGDKPRSFGDKPQGGFRKDRPEGDRPRSFGDKPRPYGDKPRSFDDRPQGGFRKDRPEGDRPRSFGGDKPRSFGDKPRSFGKDRPEGDRPRSFGDKPRPYGDKPRSFGDRPQGGFRKDRPEGDRPRSFGDKPRSFGDKPRSFGKDRPEGDRPRSFGDKPRSFGDKPRSFGKDRPEGDRPRSFGDKPRSYGKDRPEGDRPRSFGDKPRSFGDRPQGGFRKDRPEGDRPRSFGDKPRSFGDKPRSFGKDRPEGDRPRSFGDKSRSFGDKPRKFGDKPAGGFRKDRPEGDRPRSFGDKSRSFGDKPRSFGDRPRSFEDRPRPGAEGDAQATESRGHMNHRALMQLTAELLFEFRNGGQPADAALSDYVSSRRFLGARDRALLSDWFFHVLRNLRRIDEAIQAAFDGFPMSKESFRNGFPVMSESGVRAWGTGAGDEREGLRQDYVARATDTLRVAVAAADLGQASTEDIVIELEKCWPFKPARPGAPPAKEAAPKPTDSEGDDDKPRPPKPRPGGIPTTAAISRMFDRAREVFDMFGADRRPTNQARRWSFPDWLWAQLWPGRSEEELDALGAALGTQAGLTLRVNSIKSTPEEVTALLRAIDIEPRVSPLSSDALILGKRLSRDTVPGLAEGLVEVQDEGSQAVCHYCAVEPGWVVVDACAGGGGKSLHLAAMMKNEGRIHALDIDKKRLQPIERRAERCGATIIDQTLTLSAMGTLPLFAELHDVDLVLIDAPCSGTGTIRRQPEIRWRFSQTRLAELRQIQGDLLEKWAGRVKVGGFLVYATCSLLESENWLVVEAFLKRHPEYEIAPPEGFPASALTARGELFTAPHRDGCDGFYAARLRRKA
ncbi:hypothetical protein GC173_13250 [bacterium]|nr:hypothetical protein [bacterium]